MGIIDPVVLGGVKPAVAQYLSTLGPGQQAPPRPSGPDHMPSPQLFDKLHPRCGEICRSFDPTRHGAKGKKGYCGITCMTWSPEAFHYRGMQLSRHLRIRDCTNAQSL